MTIFVIHSLSSTAFTILKTNTLTEQSGYKQQANCDMLQFRNISCGNGLLTGKGNYGPDLELFLWFLVLQTLGCKHTD